MLRKITLISVTIGLSFSLAAEKAPSKEKAWGLIDKYCYSCHDEDVQKGDIRLDNLDGLTRDLKLGMLNKVQEQVYFKQMPPKKKKKQPTEDERKIMTAWLSHELHKENASKLEAKLRKPAYGNFVEHEKLFSGEYKDLKPCLLYTSPSPRD